MTRIACLLLAAAAALAAGCGSSCDVGDVTLYWTFTDPAGASHGCTVAGGVQVRIFVDGQPAEVPNQDPSYDCQPFNAGVDGITLLGFRDGDYAFQLEGYDASGNLLYLAQPTVAVRGCGNQRVDVALSPEYDDLKVAYGFADGGNCTVPGSSSAFSTTFIWYHLLDANGKLASAADASSFSQALPCSDTNRTFTIPSLPFASGYRLAGMEEVEIDADGRTYVVYRYNCVQGAPFDHLQAGDAVASQPLVTQGVVRPVYCF
jgi:hypothetical protein